MSVPVLIGFAGVLVAAVATGMLAGCCVRQPRLDLIGWTASTLGLTIALAAQSMGFASGFGPATFRAVQLFAVLLAPLWLGWGLVERVAASETARFAMRLLSGALTVVSGVILATDPLTNQAFSKAWPLPGQHYEPVSHYVLDVVQVVAVAAAAATAGLAAARARNDRRWLAVLAGTGPVTVAVLITVALRFSLPSRSLYPLLSMMAAALIWFGASRLTQAPSRAGRIGEARDARGGAAARGSRGSLSARADDDPLADEAYWRAGPPGRTGGRYAAVDPRSARYRSNGSGAPGEVPDADRGARGRAPPRPDGDRAGAAGPQQPGLKAPSPRAPGLRVAGPRAPGPQDTAGLAGPAAPAVFTAPAAEFGGPPIRTAAAGLTGPAALTASPDGRAAKPYGRILLFTLLDDRAADFDRLAGQTAEEVMTSEPDTLVYVIHTVPNAPMQRIFYEIYRDRAAFDRHESQPYMQRFVTDRRPLVLATNVIELRLKFAKVAPLPNPPPDPALPAAPLAQLPPGQGWGPPVPQSLQPLPPARAQRRYGGG